MLNRDQKTPKPMSIFVLCGAFEDQKTKQGEGAGSEGRPTAGFFKTSPNDVQQRLKLNESAILQKRRRLFSSIGNLMPLRRQLFLKARPLHVSRLLQHSEREAAKGIYVQGGGPD